MWTIESISQKRLWRPTGKRLFVFHIPERQKINGSSLYSPNDKLGSYTRPEDVWVLSAGKELDDRDYFKGMHLLLHDSFELEGGDFDLWEVYKDDKEFTRLKEFSEQIEGKVVTKIVYERSLICEVMDYDRTPVIQTGLNF